MQPKGRTVQGTIEDAINRILGAHRGTCGDGASDDGISEDSTVYRLTVAGRTDAGVHASHQVCHLDVPDDALARCVGHMRLDPVSAFATRLSRMMPDDIAIHDVSVAPDGFDARFSALERTYVYRVCDARTPWDPRLKDFVWRTDRELDVARMNEAAALTLGLHDFGSFAIANPGGTTIRDVKRAHWRRVPTRPLFAGDAAGADVADAADTYGVASADVATARAAAAEGVDSSGADVAAGEWYATPAVESGLLCFTIVADAFARNMVRSLVGACVQVGIGKRDIDWFARKMAVPLREGSTGPIAPQGLTLEHIAYPADDELAARAERIRARRTLPEE